MNLAARMQAAAEPGTVLITANTQRLVAGAFELEDLGEIVVKGKADPIHADRVLGLKAELRAATAPTWIEGRCVSYGRTLPYHLVLDLVRSMLGIPFVGPEAAAKATLDERLTALLAMRHRAWPPTLGPPSARRPE